ncbi:DUF2909 domain-containing protein [Parahaliea maris]|uniref:DUF2909 domain-containing protein n=2 Tax=Parahaliea maris TaxID=2716870 RepID=A0A5C9A0J7_9GAMM|nr:DUF2909 domain-containing protein [Parahaliea maris]
MLLMVALVVSLGSGFYFLMVDQGDRRKRRLFHSLGVRLALAISLATLIVFGVATGQLGHRNPWDAGPAPAAAQQPPAASESAPPEPAASGDTRD